MENENTVKENEVKYELDFDKEEQYTNEVAPLLTQLSEICDRLALPHLLWVVYKDNKKTRGQGLIMHSDCRVTPDVSAIGNLANRKIDSVRHALVLADMIAARKFTTVRAKS